jgi:hypothetical protein
VRFLVEWHSWRNPRNPLGLPGFQWESSGMCGGVKSLVHRCHDIKMNLKACLEYVATNENHGGTSVDSNVPLMQSKVR